MKAKRLGKELIFFTFILTCSFTVGCQQTPSGNKDEIIDNPKVKAIDPADTSSNIAPDQTITITFSKEMDGDTINTDNIMLYH